VGHSIGGLFVRLYASRHPEQVAGMVLIDPYSERLSARMTPAQWRALVAFNRRAGSDTVETIPGYGDLETLPYGGSDAVMRAAARASPLRPVPLAVLAHGRPFALAAPPAGLSSATLEAALRAANAALATLVPRARFFVAADSGHDIHQDQPALVTEAIRQVVEGVRHPDTWDDLAACCARQPPPASPGGPDDRIFR
ncbi:alpha/beta fold hydrolase, partial [Acidisphaera rubrifaciens]|uniref:alpha/beta fold hydrolase n=1 Tax=Acidisphaera rubrifaciens TaxID=50715 RepID=UPI0006628C01